MSCKFKCVVIFIKIDYNNVLINFRSRRCSKQWSLSVFENYETVSQFVIIITIIFMKVMNDHRSKFSNLSSWKEKPEKKIRASTVFEPVTSAIPNCTKCGFRKGPQRLKLKYIHRIKIKGKICKKKYIKKGYVSCHRQTPQTK